nr:uncharacterized protein LOC117273600 [Nicotiana tomentosiformis]
MGLSVYNGEYYLMAIPSSTSSSSSTDHSTPIDHSAASRLPFHPDDYTHPCHPLYVHPSDLLGSSLVTEPFDGSYYGSWRRSILVRCNDLVISWLANSVTKEIHRIIVYSEFAKDIWKELETRYGKTDIARVFELKKEVVHIYQCALDSPSYFNKLKQLWDESSSLSTSSDDMCTCRGSIRSEEKQKIYQFLMGLNDTYVQVSAASHFSSESASFNDWSSKQPYTPKVNFDNERGAVTCKYCKKRGQKML